MKKAGLYDRNRYPYNARLLQSANTTFDTRGSDIALGSGVRSGNNNNNFAARASRQNRFRETNASLSDTRSQTSDRMADFDGFSDTRSQRSYATSKARTTTIPATFNYNARSQGVISTISMNHELIDEEIQPRVRTVTKFTWTAFILQIFVTLLSAIALFSPGWGRATQDQSTNPDIQSKVFLYYGLFLRCTLQQYEEYWGDLDCRTNALIGMDAWWTICQAFSCIYLMLSIVCLIIISYYAFRRKSNRHWPLVLTHVVFSAINCVFLLTVVVLFATQFLDDSWWCCPNDYEIIDAILYWCWYLALAACVFQIVAFIMTLVEAIKLRR